MSLPRYGEYKDSGLDWVGQVPSHWLLTKTKHICQFSTGWTPPTGDTAAYEGENLWATISDLGARTVFETSKRISDSAAHQSGIDLVSPGSLMFSFKLSIGQVSFAGQPMYTNEAIATFRESSHLSLAFAYYAFPLFLVQNAAENIYGAKLLNQELIRSASLALPALEEQATIAAFLDRETAKIDALIAEQEKLIALLAEKRQATISHAVTRGLDPNAPMKDSGVAWLGEVPAHWEVAALKRYWSVTDCKHITAEFVDDGYPLASIREVQSRHVSLEAAKRTTPFFYEQLIEGGRRPMAGDLIFSRNATVGEVAQVDESHPPFAMGQDVCLLRRLSDESSSDFMQSVIRSGVVVEQLKSIMIGSTFKRVNVEEIRALQVPAPPPDEQAQIAEFIAEERNRLDILEMEAERAIGLLKERRSALIGAAVTGQIDVRAAVFAEKAAT